MIIREENLYLMEFSFFKDENLVLGYWYLGGLNVIHNLDTIVSTLYVGVYGM